MGAKVFSIPFSRAFISPIRDLIFFGYYLRFLKKISPDIVLCYTIKPIVFTAVASIFLRKIKFYPLVTGLGFPFIEETRKNKPLFFNLVRGLYKIAASRCSKIIFQNSDDQKEFYELKILNSFTKTAVVEGSGVDTEKFELKELPDLKMVRFLMISRLLEVKGYLNSLRLQKI